MLELLKDIGGVFAAVWNLFLMAPLTCITVVVLSLLCLLWAKKHIFDWANAGWPDEWPPKKK